MAETLAEIQQLHAAYEEAVRLADQQDRVIVRQQDRIAMLEADLASERERARVCERKLIRLAANQRNISRIAQDGDEIMRSVQDWEPEDSEDERTCREIVERLPARQDEQEGGSATLPDNRL